MSKLQGYVCPNCGAMISIPKTGRIYHCSYCNSDYEKEYENDFLHPLKVEVCPARLVTLGCRREIPMEYTRHPEAREKVIEMTMKDIARELAEGLIPYMEFTEEFDPMRMTTIIGGKVKIADREY